MLRWPAVRCGPLDRRCGAGRLRCGDAQRRAAQSSDANLRRAVCHGRAVAGTPGALQRHPPGERFALQQEVLPRQRQRLFRIVGLPQRGEREFAAVQVRVVAPAPQFGVALSQHRARAGPAAVAVLAPSRAAPDQHRIGLGQPCQRRQCVRCVALSQQQFGVRDGGVEVGFERQACAVGESGRAALPARSRHSASSDHSQLR